MLMYAVVVSVVPVCNDDGRCVSCSMFACVGPCFRMMKLRAILCVFVVPLCRVFVIAVHVVCVRAICVLNDGVACEVVRMCHRVMMVYMWYVAGQSKVVKIMMTWIGFGACVSDGCACGIGGASYNMIMWIYAS